MFTHFQPDCKSSQWGAWNENAARRQPRRNENSSSICNDIQRQKRAGPGDCALMYAHYATFLNTATVQSRSFSLLFGVEWCVWSIAVCSRVVAPYPRGFSFLCGFYSTRCSATNRPKHQIKGPISCGTCTVSFAIVRARRNRAKNTLQVHPRLFLCLTFPRVKCTQIFSSGTLCNTFKLWTYKYGFLHICDMPHNLENHHMATVRLQYRPKVPKKRSFFIYYNYS